MSLRGLYWGTFLTGWLTLVGVALVGTAFALPVALLSVAIVGLGLWRGYFSSRGPLPKTLSLLKFAVLYGKEVVLANLTVARHVLSPISTLRTAIIAIELSQRLDTDAEIALLSNLISFTPGTLTVEHSLDRHKLYIHVLYREGESLDAIRQQIKQSFELRVLEVLDR